MVISKKATVKKKPLLDHYVNLPLVYPNFNPLAGIIAVVVIFKHYTLALDVESCFCFGD